MGKRDASQMLVWEDETNTMCEWKGRTQLASQLSWQSPPAKKKKKLLEPYYYDVNKNKIKLKLY